LLGESESLLGAVQEGQTTDGRASLLRCKEIREHPCGPEEVEALGILSAREAQIHHGQHAGILELEFLSAQPLLFLL